MHFGPKADEAESHQILDRSVEMGITFIDTANVYGGDAGKGRSEEIIGSWLAARPGIRDEVVLATKVYHPMGDLGPANDHPGFSAYKVRQHLAASLRRLQTDRIDLYQVHHIDEQVSAEELWGTFERVVSDGDVLYAGSSNFSGWGRPSVRCKPGSADSSASSPSRRSTTCSAGCQKWRCCPRRRTSASECSSTCRWPVGC
jgi:aryl-alcohol dehydrogenase-like predicted oxidoreductase